MLGQIKPSFINSTPVANLAAFDRIAWQDVFLLGVLELDTLDTRRFLFQLPELLSRWLDQAFLRPDTFPGSTIVRPFRSPGIMITNASFEICCHSDVKMSAQILYHVDPRHDFWLIAEARFEPAVRGCSCASTKVFGIEVLYPDLSAIVRMTKEGRSG
jgi:hypothetical protein